MADTRGLALIRGEIRKTRPSLPGFCSYKYDKCLGRCGGSAWKISGVAVRLKVNCFYESNKTGIVRGYKRNIEARLCNHC
jgi:hypothetical protein